MLKHVIIQSIFLIAAAIFFIAGHYIKNELRATKKNKILYVISFILSTGCVICEIAFSIIRFSNVFPIITFHIILVLPVLFFLWYLYDNEQKNKMKASFYALLIFIGFLVPASLLINFTEKEEIALNEKLAYNENIIAQSPKVEEIKHPLISATDGSRTEGSLNGSIDGKGWGSFFVQRSSINGSIDGELQEQDIYKFYYIKNEDTGEIRLMTLYANDTPLFYIEDDETPYLLEKIYTPYSLNYNVDPPVECCFKQSYSTYELHIPKNSIVEVFEFDTN